MDQRDTALDRLATLTGATARAGQNGQVDVYVGNSVLVSGVTTRPLTVNQTSAGYARVLHRRPRRRRRPARRVLAGPSPSTCRP